MLEKKIYTSQLLYFVNFPAPSTMTRMPIKSVTFFETQIAF